MATRLLVIEDDEALRPLIATVFEREGYQVEAAATGAQGLEAIRRQRPDVVILDLRLPDLDGLSVCAQAQREDAIPILVLTGDTSGAMAVRALEAGATDYVRKPVDLAELVARVRSTLRSSPGGYESPGVVDLGELVIDESRGFAQYKGSDIGASSTELRLLRFMAQRAGWVLRKDQLLKALWLGDRDAHTIEVHISNLRRKLRTAGCEHDLIRTVHTLGYRLEHSQPVS